MARAGAIAFRAYMRLIYFRAARHRRGLAGVTFVGITGSCGKTTTKELVAAVLARHPAGPDAGNELPDRPAVL